VDARAGCAGEGRGEGCCELADATHGRMGMSELEDGLVCLFSGARRAKRRSSNPDRCSVIKPSKSC
jgi:hypothetical protein